MSEYYDAGYNDAINDHEHGDNEFYATGYNDGRDQYDKSFNT